jgi:hypothetical protein
MNNRNATARILDAINRVNAIGLNVTVPVRGMCGTSVMRLPSGGWAMKYHGTFVAAFGGGCAPYVDITTNGYYTATTARRINQALAAAGRIGWCVNRTGGYYVIRTPTLDLAFTDEVMIDAAGKLAHAH